MSSPEDAAEPLLAALMRLGRQQCWYCGTAASVTRYVVEHCTPTSRGGSDRSPNLVIACWSCNCIKGPRTVDEFRSLLAQRWTRPVVFFGETAEAVAQLGPLPAPDPARP